MDEYIGYTVDPSLRGRLFRYGQIIGLLSRLRRQQFDAFVYLIRSERNPFALKRDIAFFKLSGIKRFIGHQGFKSFPPRVARQPLPMVPHQVDQILDRLTFSGIPIPPPGRRKMDLNIGNHEKEVIKQWVRSLPIDKGRNWIAVAPGSKMAVKIWPLDRYARLVAQLIEDHDIWPVVFGGSEDRKLGEILIKEWNRGYVAAGQLNIRQGIAALQKCTFYLGNDTGTMHMAVAAGISCVAIFSSRDYPGNWYPYGNGHIVFRTPIDCEGCMLERCVKRGMKCILSIDEDQVYAAAEHLLSKAACTKESISSNS